MDSKQDPSDERALDKNAIASVREMARKAREAFELLMRIEQLPPGEMTRELDAALQTRPELQPSPAAVPEKKYNLLAEAKGAPPPTPLPKAEFDQLLHRSLDPLFAEHDFVPNGPGTAWVRRQGGFFKKFCLPWSRNYYRSWAGCGHVAIPTVITGNSPRLRSQNPARLHASIPIQLKALEHFARFTLWDIPGRTLDLQGLQRVVHESLIEMAGIDCDSMSALRDRLREEAEVNRMATCHIDYCLADALINHGHENPMALRTLESGFLTELQSFLQAWRTIVTREDV